MFEARGDSLTMQDAAVNAVANGDERVSVGVIMQNPRPLADIDEKN